MSEKTLSAWRQARLDVTQACECLESPTLAQLERCHGLLEAAAARLASPAEPAGLAAIPQAGVEAAGLARALRAARGLLEHAAGYHYQWGRTLGALVSGYTREGEAAPVEPMPRFSVEG